MGQGLCFFVKDFISFILAGKCVKHYSLSKYIQRVYFLGSHSCSFEGYESYYFEVLLCVVELYGDFGFGSL